jgi:predicted metal-dependent hydrolase
MFQLKNHLYRNKAKYPEFEKYIDQLNTNLSEMNTLIYETDPKSDLTSYSVNKGQELSFCLKSKKTGQFHKLNLLMYVAIHEMAHIGCPETGHGELFKKIFKFLTEEAIKINLYSYESYGTQPVEYCGMILSSSIV